MTNHDKVLGIAAWVIAFLLIIYHGFLAYWHFMPTSYWIEYHGVDPVKKEFKVDEILKFRSHTTLHKNIILTFNDILYCRNEVGDLERYSSQDTKRLHNLTSKNNYTDWPYSPGVAYPTECCLESNINLHLPVVERHLRYDGCFNEKFLKIIPEEKQDDTRSGNEIYQSGSWRPDVGGDNLEP